MIPTAPASSAAAPEPGPRSRLAEVEFALLLVATLGPQAALLARPLALLAG